MKQSLLNCSFEIIWPRVVAQWKNVTPGGIPYDGGPIHRSVPQTTARCLPIQTKHRVIERC
jgi:hypothetical protein